MLPPRRALLAALALLLARPAAPTTILLDGLRDPAYVLVAEDASGDFVPEPGQSKFLWADLTRFYVAYDTANLYAYVDLPNFVGGSASGEIGLTLVVPDGATAGSADDPWWPLNIAYAFDHTQTALCPSQPRTPVRHPEFLIRGEIKGVLGDPYNRNSGFTFLATRAQGAWQDTEQNWGGIQSTLVGTHVAYADAAGVEFSIPWSDLGLSEPTPLYLSFFTSARGLNTPAVFDTLPPDVQGSAAVTSTTLTQLVFMDLPLAPPQSLSLGCANVTAPESAGAAVITATLHSVLTQTVAVSYTTTALTAGLSDFSPVTGTLTFAPGATRQGLNVTLINDTAPEGSETFLVTLSNPANISLSSPLTTTVTITDDDAAHRLFLPHIRR